MKEIIAYASEVNEAREVAGFALAGVPIGASTSNLREDAIEAILRAAGPGIGKPPQRGRPRLCWRSS
jgi:hypothetical protein